MCKVSEWNTGVLIPSVSCCAGTHLPFYFLVSQVTSVVVLVMVNSNDLVKKKNRLHILQILNVHDKS